MGCIICATRGGAGSRAVQLKAVSCAQETGHKLVFLYVLDTSALDGVDDALVPAVRSELSWLGQTLLRMAQMRAEYAGISSEIVIREGLVREEICRFLDERSADLLLLGAPRGTTDHVIGDDRVEQFAREIEEETSIPVEIVRPETINSRSS